MEAAFAKSLSNLFSIEEKKSIPYFDGKQSDGKLIHSWLVYANKIGDNNDWNCSDRVKNFSDRLVDDAMEWHESFMGNLPLDPRTEDKEAVPPVLPVQYTRDNLEYKVWESAFIERFINAGQIEKLRNRLNLLRQGQNQNVISFIFTINTLSTIIKGPTPKVPNGATNRELNLYQENMHLRNQEKFRVLLKGLLPSIKKELWSILKPSASYEEACQTALHAESIVVHRRIMDEERPEGV